MLNKKLLTGLVSTTAIVMSLTAVEANAVVIMAGSASSSKTVSITKTYNYGYYCDNGVVKYKTELAGAMEYLGLSNLASTTQYYYESVYDLGVNTAYTGYLPFSHKTYTTHPSGNLPIGSCGGRVTAYTSERYQVTVTWTGTVTKPDTRHYSP